MKKTNTVLLVVLGPLAVLLLLGLGVFGIIAYDTSRPFVLGRTTAVVVYEIDPESQPDDQVVMTDELADAIDRRINPHTRSRSGVVRVLSPTRFEVHVFGNDPSRVDRIKRLVERPGTLEFRILANNRDHTLEIKKALESEDRIVWDDEHKEKLAWWVPVEADQEANFDDYEEIAKRRANYRGKEMLHVLVVNDPYNVTGGYLNQSRTGIDQQGRPCVFFEFTTRGGQLLGGLTGENLPDEVQDFSRKLGIILDGNLYSAPAIRSTIYNRGEITGGFTREEVEDLVDVLSAGSLPGRVRLVEQRNVGKQ